MKILREQYVEYTQILGNMGGRPTTQYLGPPVHVGARYSNFTNN